MRQSLRTGGAIVFAYLLQSAILPFFRVQGALPDALAVTVFAAGFSGGMLYGFFGGVGAALLVEGLSGDLAGLAAAVAVLSGLAGSLTASNLRRLTLQRRKKLEAALRRFAPPVAVGLFCAAKELVYAVYFYLRGVDLTLYHVSVALVSGGMAAAMAVVLLPLLSGFMLRAPQDAFIARWRAKRAGKKKPGRPRAGAGPAEAAVPIPPIPEGGKMHEKE